MALENFTRSLQDIMRQDAGISGDAQRIEQLGWMFFLKVYDFRDGNWEVYRDDFTSIIPEGLRWSNWAVDKKDGKALTGDALLEFVNNKLFPGLKNLAVTSGTPFNQAIVREVFSDSNQYMKDGVLLRKLLNKINEDVNLEDYRQRHAFGDIYENILRDLQGAGNAGEFYTPRPVTDFMVDCVRPVLGERVADFAAGTCGFLVSALTRLENQSHSSDDWAQYGRSVYGVEKKPMPYLLGMTNLLLHRVDIPELYHGNALERDVTSYPDSEKFDVILMNPPYGGIETENIMSNFPVDMRSNETADLFLVLAMYRLKAGGRAAIIIPDGFLFGTDGPKLAIKKHLLENFRLHTVVRLPAGVFSPYTSITTNILFFENDGATRKVWFYRVPMLEDGRAYSKSRPFGLEQFGECVKWWDARREVKDADGFEVARCVSLEELAANGYGFDYCGYPSGGEELPGVGEAYRELEREYLAIGESMRRISELMGELR